MVYTVTFNPAIDYVVHTGEMKLCATTAAGGATAFSDGLATKAKIAELLETL